MESSGWVRLHRKSIESQAFQNDSLWKIWTWCIMKANHQDNWVSIQTGRGLSQVHVKRGQFIFGRKSAAKELRMKPSSIRNRMEKLKSMRNVDIQPDTHYSLVTIMNYDTYNSSQNKEDRQQDRQGTGKGQPKDTNNNEDNGKNEKKDIIYTPDFEQFWNAYPKKKGKIYTFKFWKKMKPPLDEILVALAWQVESKNWLEDNGQYIPNPATYLSHGDWEDEPQKQELSEADQVRGV